MIYMFLFCLNKKKSNSIADCFVRLAKGRLLLALGITFLDLRKR